MNRADLFDLDRLRLVVALSIVGVTSAIWSSSRLAADNRVIVVLATAATVVVVIAYDKTRAGATTQLTVGRCVLASIAGLELGAMAFDVSSPHINSLVWLGILATLVAISSSATVRFLGAAGAVVAVMVLILSEFSRTAVPEAEIQVLAAGCAALAVALGASIAASTHFNLLAGIAVLTASMLSAIASVNDQHIWTTSTIVLLVAAVVFIHPSQARAERLDQRLHQLVQTPNQRALELTAAMSGAAAIVLAGLDQTSIGWAVAGAIGAGAIGLGISRFEADRGNRSRLHALERAADESRIDSLTQMSNRRGLDERLAGEIARARRFGHPFSVLMIDIDNFKQLNDRFGHAEGDFALRQLASAIERSTRSIDLGGRFGGEEFLVLLPETELDGAIIVAERVRSAAETTNMLTVSIGVAELDVTRESGDELVAIADSALYEAKRKGKNRVESAG